MGVAISKYVACMYDKKWYIGMIQEVCEEEGDKKSQLYAPIRTRASGK